MADPQTLYLSVCNMTLPTKNYVLESPLYIFRCVTQPLHNDISQAPPFSASPFNIYPTPTTHSLTPLGTSPPESEEFDPLHPIESPREFENFRAPTGAFSTPLLKIPTPQINSMEHM